MKLTIGYPTYDDYHGVEMTIQSLALYHELGPVGDLEIIVCDNLVDTRRPKPDQESPAEKLEKYVRGIGGKYVPLPSPNGTAPPRDEIFRHATGDVVIVADSHVMFAPGMIPAVREYFADHWHAMDILSGPILRKRRRPDGQLATLATHYADVWRAEMWGVWATAWQCKCKRFHFDISKADMCEFFPVAMGRTPVTECPICGEQYPADLPYSGHTQALTELGFLQRCSEHDDGGPFEITGMGLGMFACRREAWPGFCVGMTGFGGGELHMHELFRRNGGRAVCHPDCGWWHRFERDRVPYRLQLWDKIRNYVLWRQRLALPMTPVSQHFVENPAIENSLTAAQWNHLLEDPINRTEWPGNLPTVSGTALAAGSSVSATVSSATFDHPLNGMYAQVLRTKRDCISHLPAIAELASRCDTVVGLVKRKQWDVAVLAGLAARDTPTRYIAHNTERDPLQQRLLALAPGYELDHVDSLEAEPVDCDLLLVDTVHSAERLTAELARWLPHCKRWIALRGTRHFGEHAEGDKSQPGLLVAARQMMAKHPEWKRIMQQDSQYGLTVLSCDPAERTIDRGVGFELEQIYKSMGITPPANCTCRALAKRMNELGPDGCRQHQDDLVKAMEKNAEQYKWTDTIHAGIRAVKTGLAFQINPLDPLRSCLKLAIKRTEADDLAWSMFVVPASAGQTNQSA